MNNPDIKKITNMLKSKDPINRYHAAIIIGEPMTFLKEPLNENLIETFFSHLVPLLDDEDSHVRYYVAEALGKLQSKKAIPYLEERLKVEMNIEIADFDGPVPEKAIRESLDKLNRD